MKKAHYIGLAGILLILSSYVYFSISGVWGVVHTLLLIAGIGLFGLFIFLQRQELLEFSGKRSAKYGSNAIISIILALIVIVAVNWIANKRHFRSDLTNERRFSLAHQTISVLKNLDEEVKLSCFFRTGSERVMRDVLQEYGYITDKISYRFIDPDKNPEIARDYKISALNTTILEYKDRTERIRSTHEQDITNAIIKVTREGVKTVYFSEGHGEKDPESKEANGYSLFKEALEKENYQVKKLFIAQVDSLPADCAVLIVAGPETELFQTELDKISKYISKGGNVIFLLDPSPSPGMPDFFDDLGIQVCDDHIFDRSPLSQRYGTGPDMPLVNTYSNHDIVSVLRGMATFYPGCRTVELTKEKPVGMVGDLLAWTSQTSYSKKSFDASNVSFNKETDRRGPLPVAAVVARSLGRVSEDSEKLNLQGKLMAFGDSDFASNRFFKASANGDILLNSVNWVAEEKDLIAIRPKNLENRTIDLTEGQSKIIFYVVLFVMPVIVLFAGIMVFLKRKNM